MGKAGLLVHTLNAGHVGQCLAVLKSNLFAAGNGLVHMFELRQPQGGLELIHLGIDAGGHHGGFATEAKVLQVVDAFLHLSRVAHNGSTFEGVEHLGGMEAQYAHIAKAAQVLFVIFCSKGMGGIVEHLQSVAPGNLRYALHLAGVAIHMHGQDSGGAGGDGRFNFIGVQGKGVGLNVYKHRLNIVPPQGMGGGHKAEGGGDHLPAELQRLQCRYQRQGAIGKQRNILYPQVFAQLLLQLLVKRAVVGQHPTLPDLLQVWQKLLQGRKIGLGNVDGRVGGFHKPGFV